MYVSQAYSSRIPRVGGGAMANHVETRQRHRFVVPESKSDALCLGTPNKNTPP